MFVAYSIGKSNAARIARLMNITENARSINLAEKLPGSASPPTRSIVTLISSLAIAAIFLFSTTMIIKAVPINVDESIQYHVIACEFYELAKFHTFWNACDGSRNLDFLGVKLKRAYDYIGAFSSYFYYPFFRLSPNILTQRLLGVFFLIVLVTAVMLLEVQNKTSVLVLFGLSFPITYQFINDTGPVRFGIFMIALTPLIVKFTIRAKQTYTKLLLNLVLGFLLFLAVEDKPFFLYFTPAIALLTIAYNHDETSLRPILDSLRTLQREMWPSAAIFLTLTSAYLLMAKTTSGQPYIFELMASVKPQKFTEALKSLLSFMVNFEKFSSMVYDSAQFRSLNISFSLLIWSYGMFFIAKACKEKRRLLPPLKILFSSTAFIASVVALLTARNAWTGHHFIYPYTFALLVVCQSTWYQAERKKGFLMIYSVFSIVLAAELSFFVPAAQSSWERYRIFDFLKEERTAEKYLIAHLSLGTYYVSSLYGHKDQLSLQIGTLDERTASKIIQVSSMVKRKILCVCRGPDCNAERLFNSFLGHVKFEEINLATDDWKVYIERKRI